MAVVDLSISKKQEMLNKTDMLGDKMREQALNYAKHFKTSWLNLGRHLYSIHEDKKFYGWGYQSFEDYTEKELGLKKSVCLKLLKAYLFLEQDEPQYLEADFVDNREAVKVPNYDQLDVLRMAKSKKELPRQDYQKLRSQIFEHGKEAGEVRKELTALMRERKQVDPEEARDERNLASIKRFLASVRTFKKDMEALKLVDNEVVEVAEKLIKRLEQEL